jgi:DNA-binding XRE family transcriptional regulator
MNAITNEGSALGFQDQALMFALAALGERIRGLPKEDRDDLYELTKEFFVAESSEDRDSAGRAIMEIFEQAPARVTKMLMPTGTESLDSWTVFVSRKIRDLRLSSELTQEQLAEKAGLPQSHICRLELGQHSPNAITLEKIARALAVPVSAFELITQDDGANTG